MSLTVCQQCGERLAPDIRFCTNCGTPVETVPTPFASPPPLSSYPGMPGAGTDVPPLMGAPAVTRDGQRQRRGCTGGCLGALALILLLIVVYGSLFMALLSIEEHIEIRDASQVLNTEQILQEETHLPNEIDIYTLNDFSSANAADLLSNARSKVGRKSSTVVIEIDTTHRNIAIYGKNLKTEQASSARQQFTQVYQSTRSYTSATIAAIRSLKGSLGADSWWRQWGRMVRARSTAILGPTGSMILAGILLLPLALLILVLAIFSPRRGRGRYRYRSRRSRGSSGGGGGSAGSF